MLTCSEIWNLLTSHGKLDRDKGVEKLQEMCLTCNSENISNNKFDDNLRRADGDCISKENYSVVLNDLLQKFAEYPICQKETKWETRLGILLGCQVTKSSNVWDVACQLQVISMSLRR